MSLLRPEFKITLYIAFVISLFVIQKPVFYAVVLFAIILLFFRIPFAYAKRGWVPISFFLAFTFLSNVFFGYGKIFFSIGTVVITEEGLRIAAMRTSRILFMVAGAKILTATTPLETLVGALGKTLMPFGKIGLPVEGLFSTMGLTLKCFPKLKDYLAENYRNYKDKGENNGFFKKVKIISSFLLPMFVQSMQSPERFFEDKS